MKEVPFAHVLAYLEEHGWELCRIHPPYRVFYKDGNPAGGLPILVEVHNKVVDAHVFREIRRIVDEIERKKDKNDE